VPRILGEMRELLSDEKGSPESVTQLPLLFEGLGDGSRLSVSRMPFLSCVGTSFVRLENIADLALLPFTSVLVGLNTPQKKYFLRKPADKLQIVNKVSCILKNYPG